MARCAVLAAIGAFLVAASACGGRPTPLSGAVSSAPTPIVVASSAVPVLSSPSSAATVRPSASPLVHTARELVFVEVATGQRFGLQVDPSATDVGHFVYSIPGRGAYSGFADKGLRASATDIVVDSAGPATFIPSAGQSPTATAPMTVTIHIDAHLDPVARTGTVALTHDGVVFALTASIPSVADLNAVALAFERATVAGDAVALYSVLNSDITSAYTAAAFAQQWTAEQARVGTMGSMRRLSVGPPLLSDSGFWLAVIEYEAEKLPPTGPRSVARYDAYFVRERTGWKVLSTVER